MAKHANGKIPLKDMTALSVGGYLLAPSAYNFELWRALAKEEGYNLTITSVGDAYRDYERQKRVFLERYTPQKTGSGRYGDVRWWNNVRYVRFTGAAAAVPGTSNHGWGTTIDVADAGPFGGKFHNWMLETGPAFGWSNDEGRSVGEPWHMVNSNIITVGSGTKPDGVFVPTGPIVHTDINSITNMEDNMLFRVRVDSSPVDQKEVGKVFICQFGPKGHCLFQHIGPEEDGIYDIANIPKYSVSHHQRDLIRSRIIQREAEWSVK